MNERTNDHTVPKSGQSTLSPETSLLASLIDTQAIVLVLEKRSQQSTELEKSRLYPWPSFTPHAGTWGGSCELNFLHL